MKNIILILIISLSLLSCQDRTKYKSNEFPLRQLVNTTINKSYSSASYFLIAGSYSSSDKEVSTIKVFANINDEYRFIEMDMSEVRIKINNNLTSPTIQFVYERYSNGDFPEIDHLVESPFSRDYIIIHCPEKYLPEKLLPIEIKS